MSFDQALSIVIRCIKAVLGRGLPGVDSSLQLQALGLHTVDQINLVIDRIAHDPGLGVRSMGYRVDANFVRDVEPSWTVRDLALRVLKLSVPE